MQRREPNNHSWFYFYHNTVRLVYSVIKMCETIQGGDALQGYFYVTNFFARHSSSRVCFASSKQQWRHKSRLSVTNFKQGLKKYLNENVWQWLFRRIQTRIFTRRTHCTALSAECKHQLSPTGTDLVGLVLISQHLQTAFIIGLTVVKSISRFTYGIWFGERAHILHVCQCHCFPLQDRRPPFVSTCRN